jgi:hypothetical protein
MARKGQVTGSENGRWRGDVATLAAIHMWVRKNKVLTGVCSICGKSPPKRKEHLPGRRVRFVSQIELHSTTGKYSRDPDEYVEICRDCHNGLKKKEGAHGLRSVPG